MVQFTLFLERKDPLNSLGRSTPPPGIIFYLMLKDPAMNKLNSLNQYSVVLMDRPNRVFTFESAVLSAVINDLGRGVQDVTLVEFKNPERGGVKENAFEIRLYLKGNEFVSINQNDEVRRCDLLGYRDIREDASAMPVSDLWNCDGLFDFLWVTPALVEKLEPYILKSDAVEVLRRIWSDCQIVIHDYDIEPGIPTPVGSEFNDLMMTRYPDRTILRPAT